LTIVTRPDLLGQRLFAKHVFARRQKLQRRRIVDPVRRDIGDRVERIPGDRLVERGEGIRDGVAQRESLYPIKIDIDRCHGRNPRHGREIHGMDVGHATGAENKKTNGLHHLYPCSPA
jgi:hypothetical protein